MEVAQLQLCPAHAQGHVRRLTCRAQQELGTPLFASHAKSGNTLCAVGNRLPF